MKNLQLIICLGYFVILALMSTYAQSEVSTEEMLKEIYQRYYPDKTIEELSGDEKSRAVISEFISISNASPLFNENMLALRKHVLVSPNLYYEFISVEITKNMEATQNYAINTSDVSSGEKNNARSVSCMLEVLTTYAGLENEYGKESKDIVNEVYAILKSNIATIQEEIDKHTVSLANISDEAGRQEIEKQIQLLKGKARASNWSNMMFILNKYGEMGEPYFVNEIIKEISEVDISTRQHYIKYLKNIALKNQEYTKEIMEKLDEIKDIDEYSSKVIKDLLVKIEQKEKAIQGEKKPPPAKESAQGQRDDAEKSGQINDNDHLGALANIKSKDNSKNDPSSIGYIKIAGIIAGASLAAIILYLIIKRQKSNTSKP